MVESEGILNRKRPVDQLEGVMVIANSIVAALSDVCDGGQGASLMNVIETQEAQRSTMRRHCNWISLRCRR